MKQEKNLDLELFRFGIAECSQSFSANQCNKLCRLIETGELSENVKALFCHSIIP